VNVFHSLKQPEGLKILLERAIFNFFLFGLGHDDIWNNFFLMMFSFKHYIQGYPKSEGFTFSYPQLTKRDLKAQRIFWKIGLLDKGLHNYTTVYISKQSLTFGSNIFCVETQNILWDI